MVGSSYMTNTTIEQKDIYNSLLISTEYENCQFINCNLNAACLSEFRFIDCTFKNCDLSLAKLNKTSFRDVKFLNCKMLGLQFQDCHSLGISLTFESCNLSHSVFYKLKLKNTVFQNCELYESDFSEADLTNAIFEESSLSGALFDNTTLVGSDLRKATNYLIDPTKNKVTRAKFSSQGLSGLLQTFGIVIE